MAPKSEPTSKPRYMTYEEVAHELGYRHVGSVANLVTAKELEGVKLGNLPNSARRITRKSFDAYCERIEAEAAKRYGMPA